MRSSFCMYKNIKNSMKIKYIIYFQDYQRKSKRPMGHNVHPGPLVTVESL